MIGAATHGNLSYPVHHGRPISVNRPALKLQRKKAKIIIKKHTRGSPWRFIVLNPLNSSSDVTRKSFISARRIGDQDWAISCVSSVEDRRSRPGNILRLFGGGSEIETGQYPASRLVEDRRSRPSNILCLDRSIHGWLR